MTSNNIIQSTLRPQNKIIVQKNRAKIIAFGKVGPVGPRGPLPESIGQIEDVQLDSLNNNDILQYKAGIDKWVNTPQEDVVDGGNF